MEHIYKIIHIQDYTHSSNVWVQTQKMQTHIVHYKLVIGMNLAYNKLIVIWLIGFTNMVMSECIYGQQMETILE